ncbi:MAG: gliding motility-associated C-terminal domain-containing protein [Saprospiraceae bacterium]|nr:gliding motility-associated C-terminal domain-containing protein [Saprospiraceae bacterium]
MKAFYLPFLLLLLAIAQPGFAQFHTNSNARKLPNNCFELTSDAFDQKGTLWTLETIDFNQPFDTIVWIMPGAVDAGGEGMVFAFHTGIISLGSYDGHLAYENLPSILGIEIDTRSNPEHGDPEYDHMALTRNGEINHLSSDNLVGPVPLSPARDNVEDGNFHSLRIRWRPPNSLGIYWDCNLLISYSGLIVDEVFGGNPIVRWGMTAGTSASAQNRQVLCLSGQPLNELMDRTICPGGQTQLNTSFLAETYRWRPAAGLDNATIRNPIAEPDTTTTYYLQATDDCGQHFADTVTVFVEGESIALDFPTDTTICDAANYLIDATIPGASYLWSDGSTNSQLNVTATGTYTLSIQTAACEAFYSQQVNFGSPPKPNLPTDTLICEGSNPALDATVPLGNYLWNDGSSTSTLAISSSGTYSVTISNACGNSTASTQVRLQSCDTQLYIPTAFSPNGDGINDQFLLQSPFSLEIEQFQIFDRWGNQVFSRSGSFLLDETQGWDGTFRGRPLPIGPYIYFLKLIKIDGTSEIKSGEINIIR